jgi:hypothetical protein
MQPDKAVARIVFANHHRCEGMIVGGSGRSPYYLDGLRVKVDLKKAAKIPEPKADRTDHRTAVRTGTVSGTKTAYRTGTPPRKGPGTVRWRSPRRARGSASLTLALPSRRDCGFFSLPGTPLPRLKKRCGARRSPRARRAAREFAPDALGGTACFGSRSAPRRGGG